MSSDAEAWAVVTSDYLGDPKPVVMFVPDEDLADDAFAYRNANRSDFLKTMMLEKFPARFSQTLMRAVADARNVHATIGKEQFGIMMFEGSRLTGVIARELRSGARAGN